MAQGEGTQAGTAVSVLETETRDQESQGSSSSQGRGPERRLQNRHLQRSSHSPKLSLEVNTNQYMHVGQLPKTQTRERTTRKTNKETRVSTHTGPGIIPVSTSQSGKHNSWSNRQSIQKHFASDVNKKVAIDLIPLWSHLSKLKTRLQRITLFPSNFTASQKEAQKYLDTQKHQYHKQKSPNTSLNIKRFLWTSVRLLVCMLYNNIKRQCTEKCQQMSTDNTIKIPTLWDTMTHPLLSLKAV